MRTVTKEEVCLVGGGDPVVALPGTVVSRAVLMGSWVPWTMGIGAFAGGFMAGSYIYDQFGTEILDGIDAVLN